MNINGYSSTYCPNHPRNIGNSQCVYDHILAAEKMLGRFLTTEEVVHHIDENRSNNDFSNLMVFKTKSDHTRFHQTGKLKKEKDYYISPANKCCDCGVEIYSQSTRCMICSKIQMRKVERPNRVELKQLIRKYSFLEIGRMFSVSDNAIRKWCIAENLPSKKKEINNYSEEEWLSI